MSTLSLALLGLWLVACGTDAQVQERPATVPVGAPPLRVDELAELQPTPDRVAAQAVAEVPPLSDAAQQVLARFRPDVAVSVGAARKDWHAATSLEGFGLAWQSAGEAQRMLARSDTDAAATLADSLEMLKFEEGGWAQDLAAWKAKALTTPEGEDDVFVVLASKSLVRSVRPVWLTLQAGGSPCSNLGAGHHRTLLVAARPLVGRSLPSALARDVAAWRTGALMDLFGASNTPRCTGDVPDARGTQAMPAPAARQAEAVKILAEGGLSPDETARLTAAMKDGLAGGAP